MDLKDSEEEQSKQKEQQDKGPCLSPCCLFCAPAFSSLYLALSRIQEGLPWWLSGIDSTGQYRRCRFDPWVRKIPWSRKWQATLVFLPKKSHGQRSLSDYSPWGH